MAAEALVQGRANTAGSFTSGLCSCNPCSLLCSGQVLLVYRLECWVQAVRCVLQLESPASSIPPFVLCIC